MIHRYDTEPLTDEFGRCEVCGKCLPTSEDYSDRYAGLTVKISVHDILTDEDFEDIMYLCNKHYKIVEKFIIRMKNTIRREAEDDASNKENVRH